MIYSHAIPPSGSVNVNATVTPLFQSIQDGQWVHAAVSYNNDTKETKLYVNGVMLGYKANDTMASDEGNFTLGIWGASMAKRSWRCGVRRCHQFCSRTLGVNSMALVRAVGRGSGMVEV